MSTAPGGSSGPRCRSGVHNASLQLSGASMKRIGFVGVGSMGARMARRLHEANYTLTVCDSAPAALRDFEDLGATVVRLPSACATSELVILMVANDAQLKEVVLERDGLLAGIDGAAPPLVVV